MRANKRNARVMVYEVLVGADAGSPFGSSALCVSQANIAESLTIKVLSFTPSLQFYASCLRHNHASSLQPEWSRCMHASSLAFLRLLCTLLKTLHGKTKSSVQ